jgi:hypothetical protein
VTDACREQRGRLGLAALGRLPEAERTALEAHLDQCAACREELAELTGVAGALAEADPARIGAAPPAEPRPALRDAVLSELSRERAARRRVRRAWAAAVAAAAVLLLVLAVVLAQPDAPRGERLVLDPVDESPSADATATAVLIARGWGTEISLEVEGLEPGTVYNVWLRRSDDSRVPAGSFTAVRGRTMRVECASALQVDWAAGLGISVDDGDTVLYGHLGD